MGNANGRRIGETSNTRSMRDLAFKVLDEFRYNGLYTAEPDERDYTPEELIKAQTK